MITISDILPPTRVELSPAVRYGAARKDTSFKRLLLLTTNHVGNNLFCTPGIRLLKKHFPNVALDVVAMSTRGAKVFVNNPDIHRVYQSKSKLRIRWLAAQYDGVIGLHHNLARHYLGDTPKNGVIVGPNEPGFHRAETILHFIQTLTGRAVTQAERSYVLCPRAEDVAVIDRQIRPLGPNDMMVGFHLGSGRTAVHGWKFWYPHRDRDRRIWPFAHYVTLARMLRAANPNIRLVLTGTKSERFLSKRFSQQISQVINFVGNTSLLEMSALMKRLRVFVTHDTGALHVACASGVPLVGLFGPTRPQHTGPYPNRLLDTILRKAAVEDIGPTEVCAAVLAKLAA